MENKRMRMVYRLLMAVCIATLVAGVATAQEADAVNEKDTMAKLGAGIALAGCGTVSYTHLTLPTICSV